MSGRDIDSVFALVAEVRFAFQPVVNIKTGAVVAVEALARPAGSHVQDLFRQAARQRRLTELDIELAIAALDSAAEHETILPLHLNVFGGTITHDLGRFDLLREKLQETGRQEHDITLEIGPPFARLDPAQLIAGTEKLRGTGFRIALDGVGDGDVPLTLVSNLQANMIKLDRTVVSGLPEDGGRMALVEAVRHICESTESQLVAEGVENEGQLNALRRNGVRLVQGNLLAPANRRPPKKLVIPGVAAEITEPQAAPVSTLATGPRVTEFLSPATTLPHDVTAEKVREVLADHPEVNGVVLVDSRNRPQWTIDRNRFLLAVTGPYGHALHAHRPASRLADEPRVVTTATTAMEALSLITSSDQSRMYDDAVVVDETGRCLGAVRAGDLIRGMAELKVEEAAALNPLTRLPGSDAIARDVTRRISAGDVFAVSWLDVDKFKKVNDTAGFSAGDDLIRSVGRSLTDAAAKLRSVQVGHVGGDDFLVVAAPEELDRLVEMVLDQPRSVADIPVSLSLATLVCAQNAISSYDEASRRLAPLKKQAKDLTGASWVMAWAGNDKIEVLRGRPAGPPQPPTPGGLLPPTDSTPPPPHDG